MAAGGTEISPNGTASSRRKGRRLTGLPGTWLGLPPLYISIASSSVSTVRPVMFLCVSGGVSRVIAIPTTAVTSMPKRAGM